MRTLSLLAPVLLLPLALLTLRPSLATLTPDGRILGPSSLIVLDPATWPGKPFPLLPHIDIGPQLATGQWTLLLYHHDCPNCQQAIPRYQFLSLRSDRKVALIEVPPYGPATSDQPSKCLTGKLTQAKEWFVTTPVELVLDNGRVVRVTP